MKTFMKILTYIICFVSCGVLYFGAECGKIGHGTLNDILFYLLPVWGIIFSIVTYNKLKNKEKE